VRILEPERRDEQPAHRRAPGPQKPARPTDLVLGLQASVGNTATAGLLGLHRQIAPAPAPVVTPPSPGGPPLRRLTKDEYTFSESPRRFDMTYRPVGPLPATGTARVVLNIHVKFKDFDRSMMRRKDFIRHHWTKAQLAQFAWPADKKAEWVGKISRVVADGWKEKFAFKLDMPGMEKHRATCDVAVRHVDDQAAANTVITAQWVPPGAPRLRSSVAGDRKTAELDARDPVEAKHANVPPFSVVRQIGPFGFDSDDIAGVEGPIREFVDLVKRLRLPGGPLVGAADTVALSSTGRASSPGPSEYNLRLAGRRAENVMNRVANDTGLDPGIGIIRGEVSATEDAKFRRVDMFASRAQSVAVDQMVAAHEAGHMFGLGDEYENDAPEDKRFAPNFAGDKPTHSDDVRASVGDEAADDLVKRNTDSIMSQGSAVKPGHYVYFLRAMNSMTHESWSLE
jgi:hypothetical protein